MKTGFLNSLLSSVNLKYTEEPAQFQGKMVPSYVPISDPVSNNEPRPSESPITQKSNADGDVFERQTTSNAENSGKSAEEKQAEQQEQKDLRRLQDRDREVKSHEQAHKAAGGALSSAPQYEYTRGPDNRQYAVAGSVQIDSNPVSGDPEATIRKMEKVQKAALAPMEPSSTDRKVAMEASRKEMQARMELRQAETEFMSDYQQQLRQSISGENEQEDNASSISSDFATVIQPANNANGSNSRAIPNSESVSANNLFGAVTSQASGYSSSPSFDSL